MPEPERKSAPFKCPSCGGAMTLDESERYVTCDTRDCPYATKGFLYSSVELGLPSFDKR